RLEHVNLTVSDPLAFAAVLSDLFDWKIRWQGTAISGGFSVHVGGEDSYVAIYKPPGEVVATSNVSYETVGGLNHLGVVVDDLEAVEAHVIAAGYKAHSHANYEPGRRFYFDGPEGVEIEVVSYP
ncbi:MAG: VOC family protein, partial [Deltaproteobacteria bacterium]